MVQARTMPVEEQTDPAAAPVKPSRKIPGQLIITKTADFFMSRQFRLIPSIAALTGIALLLGLGTWQVVRLQEKNRLLQEMRQTLAQPAADLRRAIPPTALAWEKLHFHPVKLQGSWIATRSFRLAPRVYEEQVGYQLIMPLRLEDNQVVLVNRGFVPDGAAMMPMLDTAPQVLYGVARLPENTKPRYAPENIPSRNEWVWLDLKAMGHEVGIGRIAPVIVYEDRVADRDAYPIGGQIPLPDHNSHKQYAVTWYCLALALLGVWMTASTAKKPKTEDTNKAAEELDPVAQRGMYPEATD